MEFLLRVDRRIWLVGLSLTTVEIGNRPLGWWDWSLSSPLLMLVKVYLLTLAGGMALSWTGSLLRNWVRMHSPDEWPTPSLQRHDASALQRPSVLLSSTFASLLP
jgi:hypothetical protein